MDDSQDKPAPDGLLDQQRSPNSQSVSDFRDDAPNESREEQLSTARRFLEDSQVRNTNRDQKADFLRSKGFRDQDINRLLDELDDVDPKPDPSSKAELVGEKSAVDDASVVFPHEKPRGQDTSSPNTPPVDASRPHAPIVTYPEFLSKPPRQPPLVTTSRLLTTLYGFTGLYAVLYGMSKYMIAPVVESLTDARAELYYASSHKLDTLVSKLEQTVSEIPPTNSTPSAGDDAYQDADDPTEMFHRDVGTQTSIRDGSSPSRSSKAEPESERQCRRLTEAVKSLSGLKAQLYAKDNRFDDARALLDVFRDELDGMTYSVQPHYVRGHNLYGMSERVDPPDEIRRLRDNIRLVKGTLLSSRSFPASSRRSD